MTCFRGRINQTLFRLSVAKLAAVGSITHMLIMRANERRFEAILQSGHKKQFTIPPHVCSDASPGLCFFGMGTFLPRENETVLVPGGILLVLLESCYIIAERHRSFEEVHVIKAILPLLPLLRVYMSGHQDGMSASAKLRISKWTKPLGTCR